MSAAATTPTTQPTYASFTELDNNFNLTGFYDDLKKTNSPLLKPLEPTLIKRTQKRQTPGVDKSEDFKFKIYFNADLDLHLVVISGQSDEHLNKVAREFNFPRGLPVIWKQGGYVNARGFYPKFDNTTKNQQDIKTDALQGATKAIITKKWSGFLIHVIAFEVNNHYYWTAASKNSAWAEGPFVQSGKRLFERYMTPALAEQMIKNNIYIGFEAMDKNDPMTHGYIAKQDALVVTCVGQGSMTTVANPHPIITDALHNMPIMTYFSTPELVEFCYEFRLPHDNYMEITGTNEQIIAATKVLFDDRDLCNHTQYSSKQLAVCNMPLASELIQGGDVCHNEIVGNILEGVVATYFKPDGSKFTLKIKFPCYTIRTFFLRRLLEPFRTKRSFTKAHTPEIEKLLQSYLSIWCCTPAGWAKWSRVAKAMAMTAMDLPLVDHRTHVEIADKVDAMTEDGLNTLSEYYDTHLRYYTMTGRKLHAIAILGPIGSGKTGYAERIVTKYPNRFTHVDGDCFHNNEHTIVDFGIERNAATLSEIFRVFLAGKVPVISCGGGVLTENDKYILAERINSYMGCSLMLKVVIMDPRRTIDDHIVHIRSDMEIDDIYNSVPLSFTKATLEDRVRRGVSKEMSEKDTAALHTRSMDNRRFAKILLGASSRTVLFSAPYNAVRPEFVRAYYDTICTDNLTLNMLTADNVVNCYQGLILSARQVRFVVRIQPNIITGDKPIVKHITRLFSRNADVPITHEDFLKFDFDTDAMVKPTVATVYELVLQLQTNETKTTKISFAVLPTTTTPTTEHITISPGPFEPKHMITATEWVLGNMEAPLQLKTKGDQTAVYSIKALAPPTIIDVPKGKGSEGFFQRVVPANYTKVEGVGIQVLGPVAIGQFDNPFFCFARGNKK